MDDSIRRALDKGHRIDITTIGRRTGRPRRIELVFHNLDGRIVISGIPFPGRTRGWIYNLEADPRITVHLKGPIAHADLEGTARVIADPDERRAMLDRRGAQLGPDRSRRDGRGQPADRGDRPRLPGLTPAARAC